jgi:lipopolysaccharide export system permease protein
MKQYQTYLLRQLLTAMGIVTLVMTGIIWLFVSVRAVESIVNRGLSFSLFLSLTGLQLPNFLILIIPIAIFISGVFVYNRLNSDREILVLRAAGVSPMALAQPMIVLGAGAAAVCYLLSLYLTPLSYQMFRDLQWDVRYSLTNVLLREGVFNTISNTTTVYIRERTGRDELRGLLIHDTRDPEKESTIIAERGAVADTATGPRVLMFDGSRQELNLKTNKLSILYFDRYSFDLGGASQKPDDRFREPRERSTSELFTLDRDDLTNPNDYGRFVVELHQRLSAPLGALGFGLIAFLFIIYGEYSRRGQASRIVNAAAAFVIIQVCQLSLINMVTKNLVLVPLLYVFTLLPIAVPIAILIYNPKLKVPPLFEMVGSLRRRLGSG